MSPALSVVIPTWNRPAELARCLEGFAAQDVPPERFEIVVVDDGSDTDTETAVAPFRGRLDLRLERRPHMGVAAARNVGVVLARAPMLILFDDDQAPLPHLVSRSLAFHAAEPDEGVFRLLRIVPEPGPRSACSLAMFEWGCVFNYPLDGRDWGHGGFWGGAVTCKASIFRYGLYDAAYGMAEDAELGLRISRWLPLSCRYDGVADALQLRELDMAAIAHRWLRMSWFHLLWQRNHGELVDVGNQPAYRDATRILAGARPLTAAVAALQAGADALGRFDPALPDGARGARLQDLMVGVRAMVRQCQATGWLAARMDEPVEAMLARVLPPAAPLDGA